MNALLPIDTRALKTLNEIGPCDLGLLAVAMGNDEHVVADTIDHLLNLGLIDARHGFFRRKVYSVRASHPYVATLQEYS